MTALDIKNVKQRSAKTDRIRQQSIVNKKNDSLRVITEQQQKFANLDAIYTPYEISNINQLKFNSDQKAAVIQFIVDQLQTYDKSRFIDLIKNENIISCDVTWDSLGYATKIQLFKISGRYGYDSYSKTELQLTGSHKIELSNLLKLKYSPQKTLNNQTKKCSINATLFNIQCSPISKILVSFKKHKNTYKYYEGKFSVNKLAFENFINKNNLWTNSKDLNEAYSYEIKYTFTPASIIMDSLDKTIIEDWFILPAN